jgi:hypothetical protein
LGRHQDRFGARHSELARRAYPGATTHAVVVVADDLVPIKALNNAPVVHHVASPSSMTTGWWAYASGGGKPSERLVVNHMLRWSAGCTRSGGRGATLRSLSSEVSSGCGSSQFARTPPHVGTGSTRAPMPPPPSRLRDRWADDVRGRPAHPTTGGLRNPPDGKHVYAVWQLLAPQRD